MKKFFRALGTGIKTKFGAMTHAQIVAIIASTVFVVSAIGAGGYFLYNHMYKSQNASAENATGTEMKDAEALFPEVVEDTETEMETEAEIEPILVNLVGNSIEKDLKIKIQDDVGQNVKGAEFTIAVEDSNQKKTDYKDDDQDGIIYIRKIEPGDYKVSLKPIEGYETSEEYINVNVKDKIVYTKVDVLDEIKDESQINAAAEDTAVNNVPIENLVTDTVSFVESTRAAQPISATDISQDNFQTANMSVDKSQVICSKTVSTQGEESVSDTEMSTETTLSAVISVPTAAILYNYSVEKSSIMMVPLTVEDAYGIVAGVTWSVDNTAVANIVGDANSLSGVTLTKSGEGTTNLVATISYYADGNNTVATTTICSQITTKYFDDATSNLYDKNGNIVYLDENATNVAHVTDYREDATYYGSALYTGWQTINGKVYYYNSDHKYVTGEQIINGVFYNFASDGTLTQESGSRGIDVSKYQGNIDWIAVKNAGIDFAIIRVGYRGSSTGVLVEDPYFKKNIEGANNAGIKVGIYFFTQAVSEAEAVEEASMALSKVAGYRVSYPIFIDTESASNGRANGLDVNTRTAVCNAFCQTIRSAGYTAGVYASKNWFINQLNATSLNTYRIWVAQYNSTCTYSGKYDLWQYTSKGSVAGINGNVDLDISYMGY